MIETADLPEFFGRGIQTAHDIQRRADVRHDTLARTSRDDLREANTWNALGNEYRPRPAFVVIVLETVGPADSREVYSFELGDALGDRSFGGGKFANQAKQLDWRAVGIDAVLAPTKTVLERTPAIGVELDLLLGRLMTKRPGGRTPGFLRLFRWLRTLHQILKLGGCSVL